MGTQSTHTDDESQSITAENGREYPRSVYHEVSRSVYSSQQQVADEWANGALPTTSANGSACTLTTGTGNFTGYQYPDGHGVIKHYSTIECYRTKHGIHITNTECWSKGWARCTTPSTTTVPSGRRYSLPLTTLATEYDLNAIEAVEQGDHPTHGPKTAIIVFDTGRYVLVDDADSMEELNERDATRIMGDLQ